MDHSEEEKVLYDLGTDGVCEFQDGGLIRINRTMLALQSKFFLKRFFGAKPKTNVKITDFDRDTFKIFLDCLFGLKKYTILDALLIYPIAHHYDVKKSLRKCTAVLEPKEMSENVCLTLNLALFYKAEDLIAKLIDFIESEMGVITFLEDQKYRSLLEPSAISKLIEDFELNTFLVKLVFDWGNDFLKERGKTMDVNLYVKETEILSKLQLSDFESVTSLLNFVKVTDGIIFGKDDAFLYFESKALDLGKTFPNRSEWFKLDDNDDGVIKETITFSKTFSANTNVRLEIFFNEIFVGSKAANEKPCLNVTVKYFCRTVLGAYSSCFCDLQFPDFSWEIVEGLEDKLFNFPLSTEQAADSSTITVSSTRMFQVKSFEITYKFTNFQNCRILKTSLSSDYENSDELYLTKNVFLS